MIRIIIKQIWNQRRQNGWIFIEMILVSFFLWSVVEPIYTLFADMSIDPGYKEENLYVLSINQYPTTHRKYNAEQDSLAMKSANFARIANYIKTLPEVESSVISAIFSYPNGNSVNGMELGVDSSIIYCQLYRCCSVEDGNFFKTLQLRDAYTGEIMEQKPVMDSKKEVYLTKNLAQQLFPEGEAIGQKVETSQKNADSARVVGVVSDFKHRVDEQPSKIAIFVDNEIRFLSYPYLSPILLRVKSSTNLVEFEERFRKEIAPQLQIGNFYFNKIERMADIRRLYELENGINNAINLRLCLGTFALLCIFLGTIGTFWIRSHARRQEIGLMKAMGASSSNIMKQFLTESWILLTIAFIPAMLVQIHFYRESVLENYRENLNMDYLQNQPVAHFLIVTAIVYVVLLFTVILATYIPVRHATFTLPSDALRDE